MGIGDQDRRSDGTDPFAFAREVQERAAGLHPGMREMVQELTYQKLGRPISIKTENPVTREWESEQVGIVLPSRIEEGVTTEACVAFNSGDITVIKRISADETFARLFSTNFSSSEEPISITSVPASRSTLSKLVHQAKAGEGTFSSSQFVVSNDREESVPVVTEAYERSIAIAQETKAERDRVRNVTADSFMSRVRALLNPPKPLKPDMPPTTPPPSLPPTQG